MTRKQVEALMVRREKMLNQHDAAGMTTLYSDDVVVDSPMAGGSVRGRAANEDVNRAWASAFPDATFTRETLVIDRDRAVGDRRHRTGRVRQAGQEFLQPHPGLPR